jgi:preprotein translocase subunit SecG
MLYTILIVALFIDAVVLVAAILLQAGKGGGLAATFGGVSSSADAILGTRAAGNLLTKSSWWCGGLSLGLA